MMGKLKNIVKKLIELKKEGDYWDFKQEPYLEDKIGDFVLDVICMANSLHKGNRYLILGVTNKHKIIGVENITNRKTQADYINLLRDCDFAGQNRPEILLETIEIQKHRLEVIIIEDKPIKPYYLNKKFRVVKPYYIYMRNGDTNTPKDKSADIYHIEKMWKQRFGLIDRPSERMQNLLLKPNEWQKGFDYGRDTYHKTFPEFSIEFSEGENCNNILSYLFNDDEISFIGLVKFKFHTTTLFDLVYLNLDGCKTMFPRPDIERFFNSGNFYYFTKNSIKGKFLYFLYEDYIILDYINKSVPIPIFESEDDMKIFLCNLEIDDNINLEDYLTKEKLKESEECSGVSLKLTIQVYEMLKRKIIKKL